MSSKQIEDALGAFVRSKQKGTDSGNYQRDVRRVIKEWVNWLADREEPVETFDQLQVSYMRQYARQLKQRVDEGEFAIALLNIPGDDSLAVGSDLCTLVGNEDNRLVEQFFGSFHRFASMYSSQPVSQCFSGSNSAVSAGIQYERA